MNQVPEDFYSAEAADYVLPDPQFAEDTEQDTEQTEQMDGPVTGDPAVSPAPVATVVLKPREERRLLNGHYWVFSNEISRISDNVPPGSLVRVRADSGARLGVGIYNPNSLIAVRLISRVERQLDLEWFIERITRAERLRKQLYPNTDVYRLLHSESDGVPGVVADRYGAVISLQIASVGMELRRDMLAQALMRLDGVVGVAERNDHAQRVNEGLEERVGVLAGTVEPQIISDGILRFRVDPLSGQKTGFYLDQRDNRISMRRFMYGARVLDLFCNSGGFSLHALHADAAEVVSVDSSARALLELETNRTLNHLENVQACQADVFSELQEREMRGEKFNVIIADPPPFARSKKYVNEARKRYVKLFARTLRLLAPEGIAFIATCSHHITRDTFYEILREATAVSRRDVIVLEERGAAPDHPVHPAMPETAYLRGAIVRAA